MQWAYILSLKTLRPMASADFQNPREVIGPVTALIYGPAAMWYNWVNSLKKHWYLVIYSTSLPCCFMELRKQEQLGTGRS